MRLLVSKNPNETCNPFLGDEDILGIILGLGFTLLSLGWTGFSYTAESKVNGKQAANDNGVEEALPALGTEQRENNKVTGIVTGNNSNSDGSDTELDHDENSSPTPSKPVSWKLNFILAMISCFIAMSLTGWGSIEADGNAANPDVSRIGMWMIVASQWIMFVFYGWTLAAPRLFPNRDFS